MDINTKLFKQRLHAQNEDFKFSHFTIHSPFLGNPGFSSLQPSQPAHIIATTVSNPPFPVNIKEVPHFDNYAHSVNMYFFEHF